MTTLAKSFLFLLHGGFMMYPLLLSALVAIAVILERLHLFRREYSLPKTYTKEILEAAKRGDFPLAKELCEKRPAPASAVLLSGLEHFQNSTMEMELSMKNRAEEWMPLLEKRIEVIDTVITAAPLMGLLGTITGMMASFQVLSEKGVNEPNAITGGVAEALIATATGLVIALVCLVAYNYLSSQVKVFVYELESLAARLLEIRLEHDRQEEKNKK